MILIPASFCDELIKISMDPETKQRLKDEAKLIGASAGGAVAAHGVNVLARAALEKKYGPKVLKSTAARVSRAGMPAAVALGTYFAGKGLMSSKKQERKRLQAAKGASQS